MTSKWTRSAPPRFAEGEGPGEVGEIGGEDRRRQPHQCAAGSQGRFGGRHHQRDRVVAGQRMAGERELAQDHARRDPFVALELDVAEAEAARARRRAAPVVVAVDEVGHDVALARRRHGQQQVDGGCRRHLGAGVGVLLDHRARRAPPQVEGAPRMLPTVEADAPRASTCAAGSALPSRPGTSTRRGPSDITTVDAAAALDEGAGVRALASDAPGRHLVVVAPAALAAPQRRGPGRPARSAASVAASGR